MDPGLREAEVVRLVDGIQTAAPSVLIGGYAVAAYGPPRFSVDVDLVFPATSLEPTRQWILGQGFSARLTMSPSSASDSMSKLLVKKRDATADLFFGGVRARESGAEIPYAWLSVRHRKKRLQLRTLTTPNPIRVVRPEALWVLKLMAGRSQDLSDLFSIRREPFDDREVSEMLASLADVGHRSHIGNVARKLRSAALYRDSLSRWGLDSPSLRSNNRDWNAFRDRALTLLGAQPE